MGWRAVAAGLDAGTACCAAINAIYFLDRLLSGVERSVSRRLALGTLALVSVATLVEALALLAIASRGSDSAALTSASWAVVRVLPFAGAGAISALIARKAVMR